jgi:hypothetical protein
MQRMTHTLRDNSERAALQDWQKNGQNQLYDRIRGVLDVSELADRIIGFLADYLNGQQGCLFSYREETDSLEPIGWYERAASESSQVQAKEFQERQRELQISNEALKTQNRVIENTQEELQEAMQQTGAAALGRRQ